jgi:hypothetical protein
MLFPPQFLQPHIRHITGGFADGRMIDLSYFGEQWNATKILRAETFNVSQQEHPISVSSPPISLLPLEFHIFKLMSLDL